MKRKNEKILKKIRLYIEGELNQQENKNVEKLLSYGPFSRMCEYVGSQRRIKLPQLKLEDKIFVLKHLRKQDFLERTMMLEEQKEKERKGLGRQGEVEGQWRDFY